jgi:hypothetical protein
VQPIPVTSLRGKSPTDRARVTLAKLRTAKVPPAKLMALALAVHGYLKLDPTCPRGDRGLYRQTQIGKALHRRRGASGTHKHWDWPYPLGDGRTGRVELHAFSPSRGKTLQHLGKAIEDACSHVIAHHLDAVLAFARARDVNLLVRQAS